MLITVFIRTRHWPHPLNYARIDFPFSASTQRTRPNPKPCVTFLIKLFFFYDELLAPRQTPNLEEYPLLAFHDYLGAGIAQWCSPGLWAGWSGVRVPVRDGNFSLHHRVQSSSGAHPASYPMDIKDSFPGGKAARARSWLLTSIKCRGQRMREAIPPLPQYTFMMWFSV
jgi:hypothetical protein